MYPAFFYSPPPPLKGSIQQLGVYYNPSLTLVQIFWLCSPLHCKNPDLKLKSSSNCLCMALYAGSAAKFGYTELIILLPHFLGHTDSISAL